MQLKNLSAAEKNLVITPLSVEASVCGISGVSASQSK